MAVFTQFFCKMYFLYVSRSHNKNLDNFFLVLPPERAVFFSKGVPGCPDFQGGGSAGSGNPLSGKVLLNISNGLSFSREVVLQAEEPPLWKSGTPYLEK